MHARSDLEFASHVLAVACTTPVQIHLVVDFRRLASDLDIFRRRMQLYSQPKGTFLLTWNTVSLRHLGHDGVDLASGSKPLAITNTRLLTSVGSTDLGGK